MVDKVGQTASPIIDDLLSHGHEFTFPQVMRLARMHLGAGGRDEIPEIPWQERVKVSPDLTLGFPPADVARVVLDGIYLLITVTFLGLYGSSSPLPTFYTEDLFGDDVGDSDSSACRDFLDLLHQRLYQLYFQCWSKYRLFIRVAEEKNPLDRERLLCLIGLGVKELRDSVPEFWSLLRYAGLLTQFPRSAEGLRALLRDALGISRLEVEQCVLRRVPIPADQRMSLGLTGMSLGVNTVLGSEIGDRMGKFRILIGPVTKKVFDSFLPGAPLHDKLARLIRIYILDPFDYDLKLTLAANEARPIRLGDPNGARLGFDSWCFSSKSLGQVSTTLSITQSAANAPAPVAEDYDSEPEPATLVEYYQDELAQLRELTKGYVEKHPEMAPLVSGQMADPGVERTFEGTALLNAHLRMKLDDDFPEVIHKVMEVVQPDSLRPVPASTIVVFSPKPNLTEPQMIPVGTELKSVPVDETVCRFTIRFPVEIHPLILTEANFAHPSGKPAAITLSLKLTGIALSNWKVNKLRLFLAGESKYASNLYLVLMRYLKRIVITPALDGQSVTLDATHLKAVGFEDADILFPCSSISTTCHKMIDEFFILPEKFLFIDLLGWEKWQGRGEGTEFEIRLELDTLPFALHQVSKKDFELFATPVVNVFPHAAEPITIKAGVIRYPVLPSGGNCRHHEVYSIEKVTGLLDKTSHKIDFTSRKDNFQHLQSPSYQISQHNSHIHHSLETFLSIEAQQNSVSKQITSLAVELECTNGSLPEKLHTGDICNNSDNSPSFAEFTNCKPVTRSERVNLGSNTLWRLYSHCNLNISLLNVRSLRAMLEQVSQSYNRDYMTAKLHTRRIEGISDFRIKPADRLFGRSMLRGWKIRIALKGDHFDSPGDLYLFGTLLDHFLRGLATESCFTQTIVEDIQSGRSYDWPVKMGRRALI